MQVRCSVFITNRKGPWRFCVLRIHSPRNPFLNHREHAAPLRYSPPHQYNTKHTFHSRRKGKKARNRHEVALPNHRHVKHSEFTSSPHVNSLPPKTVTRRSAKVPEHTKRVQMALSVSCNQLFHSKPKSPLLPMYRQATLHLSPIQ